MDIGFLAAAGGAALRHRITGRRTPLNVMFALTNVCNSRCGYCGIYDRAQPALDTATVLRLLDEMAAAGTRRVGLWGGEPLTRKDIGVIVDHCADLGFWTSLDTNGHLFPEKAHRLRRVSHLLFSYDGPSHDRNREPGSRAKVLRAMEVAVAEGFPFWTLTVLTRHNLDEIDVILDEAEARGAMAIFQVLHHPDTLTGGRGAELVPEDAALRRAIRRLRDAHAAGRPVANSPASLDRLLAWPDFARARVYAPQARCAAGRLFANVDADGRVYPCSLLVGAVPPGKGDTFDAAFQSLGDPPCTACTATAFTEYSALFALDPRVAWTWVKRLWRPGAPVPIGD